MAVEAVVQFMWSQTSTSTVCPKPEEVNATDVALRLVNATVLEPCTAGSTKIFTMLASFYSTLLASTHILY